MRRPLPRRAETDSGNGQYMQAEVPYTSRDQPMAALFRETTMQLHLSLHEHPLIVELLTRPSFGCYRATLEAFLRFYEPAEPALIECSRRFGVAEQYPRPDRTDWLSADLEALGHGSHRMSLETKHNIPARLMGIGDLVGCLYVIRGSALGGRTILRRLTRSLDVDHSCRFLTGDGERTTQMWRAFQQFCNHACRRGNIRQAALVSAKQTFVTLAECLTWSMGRSRSDGENGTC